MINNDASNQLNRYFNRPADGGGNLADTLKKRLKAKQEAMADPSAKDENESAKIAAPDANKTGALGRGILRNAAKDKKEETDAAANNGKEDENSRQKTAADAGEDGEDLSPMEKRRRELQAIMDRLNAEEAQRNPRLYEKQQTAAAAGVGATDNDPATGSGGIEGFLNDMPLFNEFKTGLMAAFKQLDSASAGSISAQYELNYTTMQYIANAAGGYDYQETTVNVKLDLNYIKAAAGGATGKEIAAAIGGSEDFASLIENLQKAGQNQQAGSASNADFMTSLQDYFSPEKTAGRILDFSTAFFGNSAAFKKYGDTEEGREEFAKIMRDAIQKGFDQAMGVLGKVPKSVQDGIDKTHELTFKGIDDFVKNGLDRNKQQQGIYDSLEQFAFNFQVSSSSKTVSVAPNSASPAGTTSVGDYYKNHAKAAGEENRTSGVNAEA